MGQEKGKQFSVPGSKASSIPLKNPEGSRGRRRTARSRDKRFKNEGEAEVQH